MVQIFFWYKRCISLIFNVICTNLGRILFVSGDHASNKQGQHQALPQHHPLIDPHILDKCTANALFVTKQLLKFTIVGSVSVQFFIFLLHQRWWLEFKQNTVCPGSSDPFYIITYYIKVGYYFLDIQYICR